LIRSVGRCGEEKYSPGVTAEMDPVVYATGDTHKKARNTQKDMIKG